MGDAERTAQSRTGGGSVAAVRGRRLGERPGLDAGTNKELRLTLGDIKAMGWLGRYYAEKIRGAVDLYRYQSSGDQPPRQRAHAFDHRLQSLEAIRRAGPPNTSSRC